MSCSQIPNIRKNIPPERIRKCVSCFLSAPHGTGSELDRATASVGGQGVSPKCLFFVGFKWQRELISELKDCGDLIKVKTCP